MKLGILVNQLIKDNKSDQILATLAKLWVTQCVAQEWANEPKRRKALDAKAARRAANKQNIGAPNANGRRIIYTKRLPIDPAAGERQYEWMFHATKGWRMFRVYA